MGANTVAIIPAAGSGTRLAEGSPGVEQPKAFRQLAGRTLLERSIEALAPHVDQIVVAVPPGVRVNLRTEVVVQLDVVDGGGTRQRSVRNALDAVADDTDFVLVHDAARPLVPGQVVRRVLAALNAGAQCVVPAIAPPDSLRRIDGAGANRRLPRDEVRLVQTPQGFTLAALRRGHDAAADDLATDDASLVEATGVPVVLVDGDPLAFKITRQFDLVLAEALVNLP